MPSSLDLLIERREQILGEVRRMLIEKLRVEREPDEIDPDTALFGSGLGLDSIDILEVSLVVSKRYGVEIKADSQDNQSTFRSLRGLAEFVARHRTR